LLVTCRQSGNQQSITIPPIYPTLSLSSNEAVSPARTHPPRRRHPVPGCWPGPVIGRRLVVGVVCSPKHAGRALRQSRRNCCLPSQAAGAEAAEA
jgi:hypothetical protein